MLKVGMFFLIASIGISSGSKFSPPKKRVLPDPVQTAQLFFYFMENNEIPGSLALMYKKGLSSEQIAKLEGQLEKFSEVAQSKGFKLYVLGKTVKKSVSLCHFWDYQPQATRVDIDPIFLVKRKEVWQVLPIFTKPEFPISNLTKEENKILEVLLKEYMEGSPEQAQKYAEKFRVKKKE